MFNVTNLIHAETPGRDQLLRELRAVADACDAGTVVVEPTLPGVRNGGDVLMHLRFGAEDDWRKVEPRFASILADPAVTHVDGVRYRGSPHTPENATGTVYRALLLRVAAGTPDDVVALFEADLAAMPRYVSTITAWQLSRVDTAIGTSPWTHVFEQQFTDATGITGPYLMHPIHWAHLDRWFDPECPEFIVRDRVCHSFSRCDPTVLSWKD